jgi:transcriptional regulator with XRE-family HTH domain
LRKLRRTSGATSTELAKRLRVHQSTISRYETGTSTPQEYKVASWADITQADASTKQELIEMARTIANEFDPWHVVLKDSFESHQMEISRWENESSMIRVYQPTVVPSLLQVAGYTRQLLRRAGTLEPPSVAAAVAARGNRQLVLYEEGKQFEFVITEAALRARVCDSQVLRAQWDRMLSLSTMPNIDIRVVPLESDLSVVALNSFVMMDFSRVLTETQTVFAVVRDEKDIERYTSTFGELQSMALPPIESNRFIRTLQAESIA